MPTYIANEGVELTLSTYEIRTYDYMLSRTNADATFDTFAYK